MRKWSIQPQRGYRSSREENIGELIGILTINGNWTWAHFVSIADFSVDKSCTALCWWLKVSWPMLLPFPFIICPSQVTFPLLKMFRSMNQTVFLAIEWNPPYSANNTESCGACRTSHRSVHCVHCWQLYWWKCNVTEPSLRKNTPDDNVLCIVSLFGILVERVIYVYHCQDTYHTVS